MIECNTFLYVRRRHFIVASMKDLFDTVPAKKILAFIKDIGIYGNL